MNSRSAPGPLTGESSFQAVAAHMPGALLQYVLGPQGEQRISWMSQGCLELWEVSPKASEEDVAVLWSMVDARDLPAMQASLLESARSQQDWTHEWRITTPSGKRKWLLLAAV